MDQPIRIVVTRIDVPLLDVFVLLIKIAIASMPLYLLAWLLIELVR